MLLTKDIYEYLLYFVDSETVLNLLSVNKHFHNEKYFERFTRKKYPLLVAFRKEESWKCFLLRIMKYIEKLDKEFGIPYIPTKTYNPETFYTVWKKDKKIYNSALEWEIVKLLVAKGADDFNGAMGWASEIGYLDIINFMIEKGADDFDWALRFASWGGNIEMVQFMMEKGAKDFSSSLYIAATRGHINIVHLMIEKGVTEYQSAINLALRGGHTAIVNYLKDVKK